MVCYVLLILHVQEVGGGIYQEGAVWLPREVVVMQLDKCVLVCVYV